MNSNYFEIIYYVLGPPQTPTNFTLVGSTDTSIVIEWIPEYNGGHVQTFNIQYRIVNETKTWLPQKIPQYNRQTYTLSGLQSNTWYELRMFAENKFDRSFFTDIQRKSTMSSVGMSFRVTIFCSIKDIGFHPTIKGWTL
jgi:hypothetical protein